MLQFHYKTENPAALSEARLSEAILEKGVRARRVQGYAPLQQSQKQSPISRGGQEPSEAAGWMRHTHHAKRENKRHSSVLKFKCKQGASSFHDNYQILEMYCSFPTPKTLIGAPAVLIMLRVPFLGPEVLFQDKGS